MWKHCRKTTTDSENSGLGNNPFLSQSDVVLRGGHSLVSGGLYALVEAAWARGEDLARHVEPLKH